MQPCASGELFVATSAGNLHACVSGTEGAPWITCLHSLATNVHLWDRESERLGESFRVLRIDMRGHGRSMTSSDRFTMEDLRDDVLAVWDELGITRSSVLGLSIGGMIALTLGLDSADRVNCLIAADCRADSPSTFAAMWSERRKTLRDRGMDAIVDATLPTWFTPATLAHRPDYLQRVEQMIRETSVSGYVGASRVLQELAIKTRLSEMVCPTLFLVGEGDGVHPQAMAEMQRLTPGSTLTSLPGAAHLSNLEQPDAFYAAALPFLLSHNLPVSP
ncbi:MAG: 3-oxoadipate enol-lactonase [Halieaceae bacterium]|jgi:3-oxoadipate enol-lactonase